MSEVSSWTPWRLSGVLECQPSYLLQELLCRLRALLQDDLNCSMVDTVLAPFSELMGPVSLVQDDWKGYLENRRTASNANPYRITNRIVATVTEAHKEATS